VSVVYFVVFDYFHHSKQFYVINFDTYFFFILISTYTPQLIAGLVTLAGLGGALSDENASLTVFAPNDEALAKLDNATVAKLTDPLWLPQLQQLLLSHALVIGAFTSDMVVDGMEAPTASGESFTVNTNPIRINEDSVVIAADIMVSSFHSVIA